MGFLEGINMAWSSIMSHKLRSSLTMLGVIIGVAAVIALVSVGQGASRLVTDQVRSLGSNLLVITPNRDTNTTFSLSDAEELQERVDSLELVMPVVRGEVVAQWGGQSYQVSLQGVTPQFLSIRNREVAGGRFFSRREVDDAAPVAVLGAQTVEELFGSYDPVGAEISLNGRSFLVVGVLREEGSSMGEDLDDMVALPATTAQRLLKRKQVSALYAKARSEKAAPLAVNHVEKVFDLKVGREDSVNVLSQDQIMEAVNSMTGTLTLMLGAIAGISLVVGGIGIMNIMLVSVAERTREIGIRKAIGARQKDIRDQFLVEATVLSLIGGVVGILLGGLAAWLLGRYAGWGFALQPGAIFLAFSFAAATGIGFGLWPALNAAKLDPITALRHE